MWYKEDFWVWRALFSLTSLKALSGCYRFSVDLGVDRWAITHNLSKGKYDQCLRNLSVCDWKLHIATISSHYKSSESLKNIKDSGYSHPLIYHPNSLVNKTFYTYNPIRKRILNKLPIHATHCTKTGVQCNQQRPNDHCKALKLNITQSRLSSTQNSQQREILICKLLLSKSRRAVIGSHSLHVQWVSNISMERDSKNSQVS